MKTRVIQNEPDNRTAAVLAATDRPGMAGWIRRHRMTTFFVLAFVFAWWSWPLNQFDIWPRQSFHAVGALLAAIVVIAVAEGRAGFRDLGRRMIRWRVPWYYYAFALLLPLALRTATVYLNDGPAPDWANLAWGSFALSFLIRLVNPMDGPMAEEPSWRGFGVSRLQMTRSPLVTAAVSGVLIALWHLPLIGDTGWIGLATTFSITFVYVWLFNRTGGSVLLVLLFHNAQGFVTMPDLGYSGDALARQQWLEFLGWTAIALLLVVADRAVWRTAPAAAVYQEDRS
jgi:membrane protease YdiL (CAAX protease family)